MKVSKFQVFFAFLFAALFIPSALLAFSNNNVRVDRFKWMRRQTEHFDIYYDEKSEKMIPRVAMYLEGAWKEVGDRLSFHVPERTSFFLYSTHNEFEQTNIVPIGEGTGGVTEAFKNRFLIFNDGSETWMKHVIYHEFGHVVQFNVLYGGFWKSIRLLKSPFYPLWFMEGMAEFSSGEVDAQLADMVVRDAVYHNQLIPLPELQGFNHLKPNQVTIAYKTGNAAMNFLADEYGKEKVGTILRIIENHFDVSSALEETLGLDLNHFDFRFREWLKDKYADFFKNIKEPSDYGEQITFGQSLPELNQGHVYSADGKKIYFYSDHTGSMRIYAYDFDTKETKLLLGDNWKRYENLDSKGRSLSLSRDGQWLAFTGEKRQKDFLYLYNLKNKKLKRIKPPFDQIRSPVFSPIDDNLVCVGMKQGFNDLYLLNMKGKLIDQLTDNPQDEKDPTFSPDGKTVLYSGEVMDDKDTDPLGRDLFSVNLTDKNIVRKTDYVGNETEPEYLPDGSLLFVRSHDDEAEFGSNLCYLPLSSTQSIQLTNLVGGAFSPRYIPARSQVAYVGYNAGEQHLFLYHDPGSKLTASIMAGVEKKGSFGESLASSSKEDENWEWEPSKKSEENKKKLTLAPLHWLNRINNSIFTSGAQPYRFRASTDLFLPFIFYSTQDGLVAADVWQASDYLGNHRVQQQMQFASKNQLYDMALFYTYARFRPEITVGLTGQRFFRDLTETQLRREVRGIGIVNYPLDRINSVGIGLGATNRLDNSFDDSSDEDDFRDRFWIGQYIRDTVTGRYLVATRGNSFNLFYQEGLKHNGGNQQYRSGGFQEVQYIPLPRESTLAGRLFYGRSIGTNTQVFREGGVDRIRAVSGSNLDNKKSNVILTSAELRMRMQYLHARTKFLFPDFFFKASYLLLFDDIGYGWDNRDERNEFRLADTPNTAGVGISWPTFILQSFQINFTIQYARRTDMRNEVWYITLGPTF